MHVTWVIAMEFWIQLAEEWMGVGKRDPSLDYHIGKFVSGMRAERVAVKMGYGVLIHFCFCY